MAGDEARPHKDVGLIGTSVATSAFAYPAASIRKGRRCLQCPSPGGAVHALHFQGLDSEQASRTRHWRNSPASDLSEIKGAARRRRSAWRGCLRQSTGGIPICPTLSIGPYKRSRRDSRSNKRRSLSKRPWLTTLSDAAATGPIQETARQKCQLKIMAATPHGSGRFLFFYLGLDAAPMRRV